MTKTVTTRAHRWAQRATVIAAAMVTAALGCGSTTPAEPTTGERIPFVAFAKDFTGFRDWPSNTIETSVAAGSTHVAGLRTVYINQLPAPDATMFPLGTLIVKVTAVDGKIFARAKRGAGYNTTGAVDWEWFELEEQASGSVVVRWHGFGPALGEMYGGDAQGGCNLCHKVAVSNDYVLAPWLTLATLGGSPADSDAGAAALVDEIDGGLADAIAFESAVAP